MWLRTIAVARGETGLIITEGVGIDHPSALGEAGLGEDRHPGVEHREATIAGWQRVVDEVHAAGGLIFPQLWHMGVMKEPGSGFIPMPPQCGPPAFGVRRGGCVLWIRTTSHVYCRRRSRCPRATSRT